MSRRKAVADPEDSEFYIPDFGLESMARQIREQFIEVRRRVVPDAAGVSWDRNRKHFLKAAKLCRSLGMPVAQFVSQQVQAMLHTGKMWPSGLTTMNSAVKAGQHHESVASRVVADYQQQLNLYRSRVRLYGALLAVRDPANDFNPLFRYCMAMQLGTPEAIAVAEGCREAAAAELLACPYLANVFGPQLLKGIQ